MKKIITIEPLKYGFKDLFENPENLIGLLGRGVGGEYRKYCGIFSIDYDVKNLDFSNLYNEVDEKIELWKITGEEIGLKRDILYEELVKILQKKEFTLAPQGTAFWIPIGLKEQSKSFEGKMKILSKPIINKENKPYKTMGLSLLNNKKNGLKIKGFELSLTQTLFGPIDNFVVQKMN